ncbi:response regulator transcription factor [Longirhabdus pacifica]|uniref:response regulator transcription factor n=1 Tax=Longirhabdus pacifica TaxID=2305227 RepID=UPI0010090336|nr:response regulator transcription factor [Longirhabdus pacifica]
MRKNILVVDDEKRMRDLLLQLLANENWHVEEAAGGADALQKINETSYDLVILDVMMPQIDGWELCQHIREHEDVPILFLTARSETKDKVYGLNMGADDYLTKPFDKDELLARAHALIRRSASHHQPNDKMKTIQLKEITINTEAHEIYVHDVLVSVTPKEFDILYHLALHPNKVFPRESLLEQIWGIDFLGDERTVDQHIKNVREKLKKAGCSFNPIQTVWGIGYKIKGTES